MIIDMSGEPSAAGWSRKAQNALVEDNPTLVLELMESAPALAPKATTRDILSYACNRSDPRLADLALKAGAPMPATLLIEMAHSIDSDEQTPRWIECVQMLMRERGADLDRRAEWGYSILHTALREASPVAPSAAAALLSLGASMEKKTSDKESPLELALCYGNVPATRFLLDAGVKLNSGLSLLHLSLSSQNPELIAFLIARGEDPGELVTRGDESKRRISLPVLALKEGREAREPWAQGNGETIAQMLRSAIEARQLARSIKPARRAFKFSGSSI